MTVHETLPLIQGCLSGGLVLVCVWSCWDKPAAHLFVLFLLGMNLWGVATFGMSVTDDPDHALLWAKVALVFMASASVLFHLFVVRYAAFAPTALFSSAKIAYAYLGVVILLSPWGLLLDGVKEGPYGNVPALGPAYAVYAVPMFGWIALSIYGLSRAEKSAASYAERNRFLYFILGAAIFLIGGFIELSYVLGAPSYPAGSLVGIAFVLLAGIAMLRERLLDLQVWAHRCAPFAILFVIVSIPYVCAYFVLNHLHDGIIAPLWLWLTAVAVLVATVPPLWRWVQSRVNAVVYRGRLEHLRGLERLREEALSVTDPAAIETYLPQLIARAMQASHVHLLLPRSVSGDFVAAGPGTSGETADRLVLDAGSPLIQWLAHHRGLLRREALETSPELAPVARQEAAMIARLDGELYVPLVSRERLVGLLVVGCREDRRPYSWQDEKLLMRIAGQMALALENIQLYRASLEREARLAALGRLTKTISSSLDIRTMYGVFAEELKKIIPLDFATIVVIEGTELRFYALSEGVDSIWGEAGSTIPLEGTATQWVAENKTVLVEPDLSSERRFWTGTRYFEHGIRSLVYLPLFSQGELFGSFIVGCRRPRAYSDADVAFLEQIASQLSLAMENTRLYAREKGERQRLEALNKQREEFLSIISHELKTPLTSIKSSGELLYEELASDKHHSRKRLIENIRRSTERMESMLNSLLNMVRLRSGPLEVRLRPIDIVPCVRNAVELCSPPIEEKAQTFETEFPDSLPPIMADPEGIELILNNLLGNANKFTPRGGSIKLSVRHSDSRVLIEVADSGLGISEAEQEFIFEPFYRGEASRSGVKGMGVGLATVKQLVQLHGGTVRVKSAAGKGSVFIVSLPVE